MKKIEMRFVSVQILTNIKVQFSSSSLQLQKTRVWLWFGSDMMCLLFGSIHNAGSSSVRFPPQVIITASILKWSSSKIPDNFPDVSDNRQIP